MSDPVLEGFVDRWDREDGPLGNGWRSAHEIHERWWDPLELRDGTPVNTHPDLGPIVQPNNSGGRASAYQDFGSTYADNFRIGIWWNGRHHAPGFPVACIDLNEPDWGLAFCYEPEIEGGVYVLWALGRRPDEIRIVDSKKGPSHVDGRPMCFEMHVRASTISCFADDREILTAAVPEALAGSTIHGFGLDVNPVPDRPPNLEVISGPFSLTPLADRSA
jgi:hypothetical protein